MTFGVWLVCFLGVQSYLQPPRCLEAPLILTNPSPRGHPVEFVDPWLLGIFVNPKKQELRQALAEAGFWEKSWEQIPVRHTPNTIERFFRPLDLLWGKQAYLCDGAPILLDVFKVIFFPFYHGKYMINHYGKQPFGRIYVWIFFLSRRRVANLRISHQNKTKIWNELQNVLGLQGGLQ